MTAMDPALAAALAAARLLFFAWAEIVLPSATLRLLDGSAEVAMRGGTFVGRDPVYGVLDSIKGLSDSVGDSAPGVTLGLIPANDTALAALLDPAVQGSPVTLGIGVLNMATGLPIGERLFQIEEGRRLSDAFHQKVWPGELGLGFVTDVETWVPWGQALDTSGIETRTNLPSLGAITGART